MVELKVNRKEDLEDQEESFADSNNYEKVLRFADEKLKEELDIQYNKYKEISERIRELYPEYSEDEPHKTNAMNKVMTWYGIEMRTMNDDSTSKLAELLMQGTNMGIIEGRKLLNHKDTDKEVEKIIEEYVEMQEAAVENLKTFL